MRFRLRTLMIAVAAVALACAAFVWVGLLAAVALVLAVGPLIGSVRAARRYEAGRVDPVSGALLGGLVLAAVLSLVVSVLVSLSDPDFALSRLPALAAGIILMFLYIYIIDSFISGLVGLAVTFCLSTRAVPGWYRLRSAHRGD
jgi:hypothetical protein